MNLLSLRVNSDSIWGKISSADYHSQSYSSGWGEMSSFFNELKRRNVIKVGVAYAFVSWLILQVVDVINDPLHLPDWFGTVVIVLLGIGFLLAIFLAWVYELTPEGIKVTTPEGPAQFHTQATGQRLNYFIIGVLCLVIVVLVIDNYVLNEPTDSITESSAEDVKDEPVPDPVNNSQQITVTDKSVAVLPFVSMSSDEEQQYFADGLSEEILNRLAQAPELKVAARTSSFSFKDKDMGIGAIGEILDVAYVLEGSVRRSKNTLRITAQLIRTGDDFHLWSKTFDRPLEDIFTVQDEIAMEVTEAMQVSLGIAKLSHMPGMTTNFLAYDAYLKGTKAFEFTSEDIGKAVVFLEEAVALDPEFALAWYALLSVNQLSLTVIPNGLPDWQMKSIQAITRITELAPNAPYTIATRAGMSLGQGDWINAEKMIREAMASAEQYGVSDEFDNLELTQMRYTGRIQEALEYVKQKMIKDPLNEGLCTALIELYTSVGDTGSALAEADRGAEQGWDSMQRTGSTFVTALTSGDREEIEKRFAQLPDESGGPGTLNASMMALIDDHEAAVAELEERIIAPKHQAILDQSVIAIWAAYFNDSELAMTALKGTRRNINFLLYNVWSVLFSEVRQLPEFAELMNEIGLANYWRTTGNWADACKAAAGGLVIECE